MGECDPTWMDAVVFGIFFAGLWSVIGIVVWRALK